MHNVQTLQHINVFVMIIHITYVKNTMIRDTFRPSIQHSSSPQKLCNTLSTAELTSGWLKYPEERKVLVHGCPGPTWPIFGWKSLSPNPLPCLRHRLDRTLPARAVGALLWRCLKLCDRRSRAIYMTCVKQQGSKDQKRLVILLL